MSRKEGYPYFPAPCPTFANFHKLEKADQPGIVAYPTKKSHKPIQFPTFQQGEKALWELAWKGIQGNTEKGYNHRLTAFLPGTYTLSSTLHIPG
jgi:hypothetical protein